MGQGYGKTYNSIARSGLSANAKVVYMVLAGYADKNRICYPSREKLLKDCRFGEARFDKAMNELVKAGIVSKERSKKGNLWQHNTYTLHDED